MARGLSFGGDQIISSMGVVGLGLALSIGGIIHLVWLVCSLRKKVGTINERTTLLSLGKVIFAALIMGIVAQSGKFIIEPILDTHTRLGLIIQVGTVSLLSLAVYLSVSYLFQLPELKKLTSFFKRKTRVKELTEAEQI